MQQTLYLVLIILAFLSCCYFGLKILDWIKVYRNERFPTNHEHFISDLYKLQKKWAKVGEILYADELNKLIIKFVRLKQNSKLPNPANFGADIDSTITNLKNSKLEEIKDILNEDISNW